MKKYSCFLLCTVMSLFLFSCEIEQNVYLLSIQGDTELTNGKELTVSLDISEKNKVKKIVFWLNPESTSSAMERVRLGEVGQYPFILKYTLQDVFPGKYSISAEIESTEDNTSYAASRLKTELVLNLGDSFQGGTVISLETDGMHGLIVADRDMVGMDRTLFIWGPLKEMGVSDSDGKTNTHLLADNSSAESEMGYWFKQAFEYNGYNDWYIPSLTELKLLKRNKQYLKNIKKHFYWSSSEMKGEYAEIAYMVDFSSDENQSMGQKKSTENMVRLVRKF